MKGLYKSGLIIFIIFAFLFSSSLIPANTQARVRFKREVNFGEPGEDPNWIIDNNIDASSDNTVTSSTTQDNSTEVESVFPWFLYSEIIISQFLDFLF